MKLYARIENEKGKVDGMGGNEYLYITITAGNQIIETLKVQENERGEYQIFKLKEDNKKWDCDHNPLCDETDIWFCKDNIPF